MARFDVYEFKGKGAKLVLDVQANLFADLETRVVIPLLPYQSNQRQYLPRLKPILKISGKKYVLITTDIAAIHLSKLGKLRANADAHRHDITDAIDFLMQGF